MLTTAQSHLPYIGQNTDFAPDTVLESLKPVRSRSDTGQEIDGFLWKFHNPVIWTATGILSASWTEYARQQLPAGDGRQW
jgi:hypothetical protein